MKIKALVLGLLIAAATAMSYTAMNDGNADQAIDKSKIVRPTNG